MNSKLLIDGIGQIKKFIGIENMGESKKVLAIFHDLVPNGKTERNALRYTYDSGAMHYLLSAVESPSETDCAVLQAFNALKNNALMDEKIAKQLIDDICNALGLVVNENRVVTTPTACNTSGGASSSSDNVNHASNDSSSGSHAVDEISAITARKGSVWKTVVAIAVCLIIVGTIIGFSIYSWQIGQWIIGTIVALLIMSMVIYIGYDDVIQWLHIFISALLSTINVIFAWLWPLNYATMAFPISIGLTIGMLVYAYFAYDLSKIRNIRNASARRILKSKKLKKIGLTSVVLMAFNMAVSTCAYGGFESILLLLCAYILPIILMSLVITAFCGKKKILSVFLTAIFIVVAHVLLVTLCPHFVHSLHAYPDLSEKNGEAPKVFCNCGEEIELSQFFVDSIHNFTCEYFDFWNVTEGSLSKYNENYHWRECPCGIVISANDEEFEHVFENKVCIVCGYREFEEAFIDEMAVLYNSAVAYLNSGNIGAAAITFSKCGDYQDANSRCEESWSKLNKQLKQTIISCDLDYLVWINPDGTVTESRTVYPELSQWSDIDSISVGIGFIAGLKSDGTVVATDNFADTKYLEWTDIVSISAADDFFVGLKKDGTVVACGNNDFGQCNVSLWTDIVSVQAVIEDDFTIGVKTDGSVVFVGNSEYFDEFDASQLGNVKYSCISDLFLIADNGQIKFLMEKEVELNWLKNDYNGIVNLAHTLDHAVLLGNDGKIICHALTDDSDCDSDCEICSEVNSWTDIHQLAGITNGYFLVVAVRDDGSLCVAGEDDVNKYDGKLIDLSDVTVKVYK